MKAYLHLDGNKYEINLVKTSGDFDELKLKVYKYYDTQNISIYCYTDYGELILSVQYKDIIHFPQENKTLIQTPLGKELLIEYKNNT